MRRFHERITPKSVNLKTETEVGVYNPIQNNSAEIVTVSLHLPRLFEPVILCVGFQKQR